MRQWLDRAAESESCGGGRMVLCGWIVFRRVDRMSGGGRVAGGRSCSGCWAV